MSPMSFFLIVVLIFLVYLLFKVRSKSKPANVKPFTKHSQNTTKLPNKHAGNKSLVTTSKNNTSLLANSDSSKNYLTNAQSFINLQRYDEAIAELLMGLANKPNEKALTLKLLNIYALTNKRTEFDNLYNKFVLQAEEDALKQAQKLKIMLDEEASLNIEQGLSHSPISVSSLQPYNNLTDVNSGFKSSDLSTDPALNTKYDINNGFAINPDITVSDDIDTKDFNLPSVVRHNPAKLPDELDNRLDLKLATEKTLPQSVEVPSTNIVKQQDTTANQNKAEELFFELGAEEDTNSTLQSTTANQLTLNSESISNLNHINDADIESINHNDTSEHDLLNSLTKASFSLNSSYNEVKPVGDTDIQSKKYDDQSDKKQPPNSEFGNHLNAINSHGSTVKSKNAHDGNLSSEQPVDSPDDFDQAFDFVKNLDNSQINLDLAKQYIELGEYTGAIKLIKEVLQGDVSQEQKNKAEELLVRFK